MKLHFVKRKDLFHVARRPSFIEEETWFEEINKRGHQKPLYKLQGSDLVSRKCLIERFTTVCNVD